MPKHGRKFTEAAAKVEAGKLYTVDARRGTVAALLLLVVAMLSLRRWPGRGDLVVESLKRVADDVSGGTITGSGHFIPEEAPDALLAELIPFLARST